MLKIGVLCYPTVGGSGVIATNLGCELAKRGHQVHFMSYKKPFNLKDMTNVYFHEVAVNEYELFKFPPYESALANCIINVHRQYGLDVIHAHYAIPHVISAWLAKQHLSAKHTLKIVATLHGTDISVLGYDQGMYEMLKFGLQTADIVTAVSNSLAQETSNLFSLDKDIHTVYNFVDTVRYSPIANNLTKKNTLLHVSNLRAVKRPNDIIDIFEYVRSKIICNLIIASDKSALQKIDARIMQSRYKHDIQLIDKTENIQLLYQEAKVFLLPSEKESFGLAALEAMACGVPVVASNVGGLTELIEHELSGFTAELGNVRQMSEYCIKLLSDNNYYKTIAKNARIRATNFFPLNKAVDAYEQILIASTGANQTISLTNNKIFKTVYKINIVKSTNITAREYYNNKFSVDSGFAVLARMQTLGKGQKNRSWLSPLDKGLYCSLFFKPKLKNVADAPALTITIALAIIEFLEKNYNIKAKCKWPNDIITANGKICGVLTEMVTAQAGIKYVIVGIGLNVYKTNTIEEVNAKYKKTDVETEIEKTKNEINLSIDNILYNLIESIEKYIIEFYENGLQGYLELLNNNCMFINEKVRVELPNIEQRQTVVGKIIGISETGALKLSVAEKTIEIHSGSIIEVINDNE